MVVAVEEQGQLLKLLLLDLGAGIGAVGLQNRGRIGDRDDLGHDAGFEGEVDAHRRIRQHVNVTTNGFAETLQLDFDLIETRVEVRENI